MPVDSPQEDAERERGTGRKASCLLSKTEAENNGSGLFAALTLVLLKRSQSLEVVTEETDRGTERREKKEASSDSEEEGTPPLA